MHRVGLGHSAVAAELLEWLSDRIQTLSLHYLYRLPLDVHGQNDIKSVVKRRQDQYQCSILFELGISCKCSAPVLDVT